MIYELAMGDQTNILNVIITLMLLYWWWWHIFNNSLHALRHITVMKNSQLHLVTLSLIITVNTLLAITGFCHKQSENSETTDFSRLIHHNDRKLPRTCHDRMAYLPWRVIYICIVIIYCTFNLCISKSIIVCLKFKSWYELNINCWQKLNKLT